MTYALNTKVAPYNFIEDINDEALEEENELLKHNDVHDTMVNRRMTDRDSNQNTEGVCRVLNSASTTTSLF